LYQSSGSVRANSGEHAIMASYPRAHAENVKEPRTVRSKKRRLKIEMEKSMSFGPPVAAQKFQQCRAAKMMNNSGGQIKLAGMIGRESISMNETARELFRTHETVRFVD